MGVCECVCVGRDENKKPTSVIMRRVERIRIERTVETWRRDMKVNEKVQDEKLRGSAQVEAAGGHKENLH